MTRTLLALAAGIGVGAVGMALAHHHDDGEKVKEISATIIKEKLDGKEAKATAVEVTLAPARWRPCTATPGRGSGTSWRASTNWGSTTNRPRWSRRARRSTSRPGVCTGWGGTRAR